MTQEGIYSKGKKLLEKTRVQPTPKKTKPVATLIPSSLVENQMEIKELAEKVRLTKKGLPTPHEAREALHEIEKLRQVFTSETLPEMENKAVRRLTNLLDIIQSRVEITEELKHDVLSTELKTILSRVNQQLQDLTNQFTADSEERRKVRQKQLETLAKLNQYLNNWV